MSEKSLNEMVNEINTLLAAFGKEAIQQTKMEKDGRVIGKIKYGFKPQYVFDAINEVIGPENWRYEAQKFELFDQQSPQAVIETKLFIRIGGEWLLKGSQFGQMQVVKGNVGDALKGAITDSIQKAFSLLSVGKDAYSGKLEKLWSHEFEKTTRPPAKTPPPSQTPPPPAQSPSQEKPAMATPQEGTMQLADLPIIDGVTYQQVGDRIVAQGTKLFDKKEMLKGAGFQWDKNGKNWFVEATAAQH